MFQYRQTQSFYLKILSLFSFIILSDFHQFVEMAGGLSLTQFRALAAGALIMLVQGSLYVFGTLTSYIASYLFYKGDKNIEINDLQIIVTISVLCVNVGMIFPKMKIFTFSHRITSMISTIGIALCVFSISFSQKFFLYILIYGIAFGVSIGFGYVAPLKNCYEHIPDRKGLCTGVCIMGFGLGALFFNLILLQLMNPENIPNDKETHRCTQDIANNLPGSLRIMSAIYLVIGMIGVFLVDPAKKTSQQKVLIANQESVVTQNQIVDQNNRNQVNATEQKLTFKDVLIKKKIMYLMIILGCTMPFGGFVAFYYKQYGLTKISDDRYFAIVGSIGSIMNGLARMFWGTMMDKISFKAITAIMNVIFIIACSSIYFAVESQFLYVIIILMTYCCYGGNFGIYPTQTMRILGAQNGGKFYWITFTGFGIGGVLQFLIHYCLVVLLGKQGFKYCFIIFGVLLIAGSIVALFVSFEYHPSELKYVKGWDLQKSIWSSDKVQQNPLDKSY